MEENPSFFFSFSFFPSLVQATRYIDTTAYFMISSICGFKSHQPSQRTSFNFFFAKLVNGQVVLNPSYNLFLMVMELEF